MGQVNCVSQFFIVERIKVVLHLNETLSNMPFFIKYFLFSSVGLLTYRILNGWYVYSCFSTLAFDVVIFCLFAHVTCIFFPSFVIRNSGNYFYGSFYDVLSIGFPQSYEYLRVFQLLLFRYGTRFLNLSIIVVVLHCIVTWLFLFFNYCLPVVV